MHSFELKDLQHRIEKPVYITPGTLLLVAESMLWSMEVFYNKLFRSGNMREISIIHYLPSLIDEMISLFPDRTRVEIIKQIDELVTEAKILQPTGIIINELLTNTMKYFLQTDNGIIIIPEIFRGNLYINYFKNPLLMKINIQVLIIFLKNINGFFLSEKSFNPQHYCILSITCYQMHLAVDYMYIKIKSYTIDTEFTTEGNTLFKRIHLYGLQKNQE